MNMFLPNFSVVEGYYDVQPNDPDYEEDQYKPLILKAKDFLNSKGKSGKDYVLGLLAIKGIEWFWLGSAAALGLLLVFMFVNGLAILSFIEANSDSIRQSAL